MNNPIVGQSKKMSILKL